ncbi:MAG TPA: tetratricopeptide repeat protein [Kofleriaceae bacterium]|nr:tetratricopeptide repeat protein [Kofleriaceae bacterium]
MRDSGVQEKTTLEPGALDGLAGECLSDDDLAALAGRALSDPELRRVEQHLDRCPRCRREVSAMAATAIDQTSFTDGDPVHAPGERLGRFTLLRPLGRGAMGEVWAARDPELDREVALKLLRVRAESLGDDPAARLRREAQAMARLNHPNVVAIYELGADGDQVFCAMELIDGVTLRAWLERPRTWREVVQVALAAGRGVAAAHAAGLVHRDIKPDNVLIARNGRTLVTDFGLARLTDLDAAEPPGDDGENGEDGNTATATATATPTPLDLTRTGIVVGTPAYMPPEQLEGERVDAAGDQYSFCVTVYEALYGARPFAGATVTELASAARVGLRRAPARRDVPGPIGRCLVRGLAPARQDRWPSMAALLGALERTVGRRRRRVLAAGLVVAAAAAAALLFLRSDDGSAEVRAAAESRIARAWNDQRHAEVVRAFTATGNPAAADVAGAVTRALDRYRDDWMTMRLDAWAATHLRGEQSGELLERRLVCLDRAADDLAVLVALMVTFDRKEVGRAPAAAFGLPPLSVCSDRERLLARGGPNDSPERRAVDGELRALEILALAGRHAEALTRARRLLARIEPLHDASLLARAVYNLGNAEANAGELASAEASLRRAVQEAANARDHRLVADTWNRLLILVGQELRRPDEALALEPAARAAVAQAGDDPIQHAMLETTLGSLQHALGHFAASRDHFVAARDRFVAARGPDHPHVANAEANLGAVLMQLSQLDEAARSLERAIAIMRIAYGENHPVVGKALYNYASVDSRRKDWAASEKHARASVAVYEHVLGANRPETASSRISLARALREQGRLPEARAELEVARDALAASLPPTHPDLARLHNELGQIAEAQKDYREAERLDRIALASLRASVGPDHPQLAHALAELARMVARRAPAEAMDLYDEALRIYLGRDGRDLATDVEILAEVSECALAAHLPGRALAWFEKMPEAGKSLAPMRARLEKAGPARRVKRGGRPRRSAAGRAARRDVRR